MDFVDYVLLVLETARNDWAADMPSDGGDVECACANYIAQAFNDNVSISDAAWVMSGIIAKRYGVINPDKECPL